MLKPEVVFFYLALFSTFIGKAVRLLVGRSVCVHVTGRLIITRAQLDMTQTLIVNNFV